MKILNKIEAAQFLKISAYTLREKAANGKIPGAKIGGQWRFVEEDLVNYLRSLYDATALKLTQDSLRRKEACQLSNEETLGGLEYLTMEKEYNAALGLQTEQKRRNCTTK